MADENMNEQKTDTMSELEKFRTEMGELVSRTKTLVEKNAALEREVEGLRRVGNQPGPQYPTTEEGWFYALQQAELRVAANPELAPQLEHLRYIHQQWRGQTETRKAEYQRETGRLEAALSQMGLEQDSPHYKTALRALAGGASFAEVESSYLKSLRDLNLRGAEGRAKNEQKNSARQGAIETGEGGGRPDPDGSRAGPTPQRQFMDSLTAAIKAKAPASQRLAAKAE